LVYCAETLADDEVQLDRIRVDRVAVPVRGERDAITLRVGRDAQPDAAWPYGTAASEPARSLTETTELELIPYHRWAERGPSRMRVWLPLAD
jgi:DUF1680 family protein